MLKHLPWYLECDEVLVHVITDDEMWAHDYYPKSKASQCHGNIWHLLSSISSNQCWKDVGDNILEYTWCHPVAIHFTWHSFLVCGTATYQETLIQLKDIICCLWLGMLSKGVWLSHDNAWLDTANSTKLLNVYEWEIVQIWHHQPSSSSNTWSAVCENNINLHWMGT